jgi:glyoxylase-like metal-dependent hydrolase (beta-lactamase superfamily II)
MLRQHGIEEEEVALILLTHGHFDHFGSALELQRLLGSHVKIAMHPADRGFLSGEWIPLKLRPRSFVGVMSLLVGALCALLYRLRGTLRPWPGEALDQVIWLDGVDMEAPCDLMERCGIEAEAILTPGHSPGSICVLLPAGEMITGDIISWGLRRTEPEWPLLVEDREQVLPSLKRIVGRHPSVLYPGHGGPFAGSSLEKLVERLDG